MTDMTMQYLGRISIPEKETPISGNLSKRNSIEALDLCAVLGPFNLMKPLHISMKMASSVRSFANCPFVILCFVMVSLNMGLSEAANCQRGCQCYRAGISKEDWITCDNGRMTKFPGSIAHFREVVLIRDNKIKAVPSNPFGYSSSSQVRYVYLDGNRIDKITDGAFSIPRHLRVVSLMDNRLSNISPGIFMGADSVEELYLDDNYIEKLKAGVFRDMQRLEILSLSGNRIDNIERNTFDGLGELTELHLAGNRLVILRGGVFAGLRDIKKIDLRDNALTQIFGAAFGSLFQLEELILQNNNLSDVNSQWFQDLENLRILDLSQNRIGSFVSRSFAPLIKLESLDLSNNNISVVGRVKFDGLGNLATLNLANNFELQIKNGSFTEVLNLQSLDLRNVSSTVGAGVLYRQGNTTRLLRVRKLMLSGLTSFPADLLNLVPNVESLMITDSNITTIPEGGFDNNTYLKEVNMSNCGITAFEKGVLHPLRKLKILDVSQNNLSQLPEDSLLEDHRDVVLCLHGNPWNCNCSISWITKWFRRRGGRWCRNSKPVCQSPPDYENKTVWEISYKNCTHKSV